MCQNFWSLNIPLYLLYKNFQYLNFMGRPLKDLADSTRARMWARMAYVQFKEMSWDEMDSRLLYGPDAGHPNRRRIMHRIYREGHNPTNVDVLGTKTNLVNALNAQDKWPGSAAFYDSPFWHLVTPPAYTLEKQSQIGISAMNAIGWYQVNDEEARIGIGFRKKESAFQADSISIIRRSATLLVNIGGLDELCVLCVQFRMAMDKLSLKIAGIYLDAARRAVSRLSQRLNLEDDIKGDLWILVEKRVFRNDWTPIDALAKSNPSRRYTKNLKAQYPDKSRQDKSDPSRKLWSPDYYHALISSDRRYALELPAPKIWPVVSLYSSNWLYDFLANFDKKRELYVKDFWRTIYKNDGALPSPALERKINKQWNDCPSDPYMPVRQWTAAKNKR